MAFTISSILVFFGALDGICFLRVLRAPRGESSLFDPRPPEAALGVGVLLPGSALPVFHPVAPDEVPIVRPADHVVSDIIDEKFLRDLVPDRQAPGAVGLFHVLGDPFFHLGCAILRYIADTRFAAIAGKVLLVCNDGFAGAAAAVYRNVELTGESFLNKLGASEVLKREFDACFGRLAEDGLAPRIVLTLSGSERNRLT